MTTSGTAVFTVTRDEIVRAALRSLKVISDGQTPLSSDFTDCAFALNLLLKSIAADGYLNWVYQTIDVPLIAAKPSYTIAESGADVTAYRPVRIASAYLRDSSTPPNDVSMEPLSRQQFEMLTPKTTPGVPTQFYYDQQLTAGVAYFWPIVSASSVYTARLLVQRPIQDIAAGATSTQNFDLPQEWFLPLRWILADEVSPEYEVDLATINMISKRAGYWRDQMANFSREEGSVFFQPDPQSIGGRGL